jgi:hypothetical protein
MLSEPASPMSETLTELIERTTPEDRKEHRHENMT